MKIPYGKQFIDKNDVSNVVNALKKDLITQGPLIEKFEKKVCKVVKSKYAVALVAVLLVCQLSQQLK